MSEQFVVGGGVGVPLTIWGARRLMCFDGLNLFGIMEDALVLTRQMRLLVGNQCFVLIILIA